PLANLMVAMFYSHELSILISGTCEEEMLYYLITGFSILPGMVSYCIFACFIMSECCFQTNNAIITHLIRKGKNKHLQTNINICLFALLETSSVDDDLSQLKKELSGSSLDVGEPGTAVENATICTNRRYNADYTTWAYFIAFAITQGHIMEDHSVDTNTREILEIPVLWFFFNLLWWQGAILGAYEILFVSGVLLTIGSKPTVQFFTKPKVHK
ncbi:hypothetical protein ACJX0J_024525, partial [Zea mays]